MIHLVDSARNVANLRTIVPWVTALGDLLYDFTYFICLHHGQDVKPLAELQQVC